MNELFVNKRFYIFSSSVLLSILIFLFLKNTLHSVPAQTIKLTQIYALLSIFYLYITLLATPVTRYFKSLPFRGEYLNARRALGVSAFYFGALHGYLAFFKQLGGFYGLGFLSSKYLIAITLSFTALIILALMAATANDRAIEKLGFPKWKALHRLVYLAGVLILIHALMLGSHFADLSKTIPKVFFVLLSLLLILEAKRFDDSIAQKLKSTPNMGISFVIVVLAIFYFFPKYVFTEDGTPLGIHAQHIKDAAKKDITYSVSMEPVTDIRQNKKTDLIFRVFNSRSGERVEKFSLNQEKIMHLIIINNDFTVFDHVHPEYKSGEFFIEYEFAKAGRYRLYTDFMPTDSPEQQFAFSVDVGSPGLTGRIQTDFNKSDSKDGLNAEIILPKSLNAKRLNKGEEVIGFKLTNATGGEIKNIEPYLGAFGHLVMIKTDTYEYIHVHPKGKEATFEDQKSGPLVEFSPLGLYGDITPGIYKLYAQFKVDGSIHTFGFFVKVE